jgi:peptidoglycan hydrolase-like protein with peptidoglycan-binding domain
MNPMILKFGAAGLALWGVSKLLKKQPTAASYQAVTVTGANGVPTTVATPVSAGVTYHQATGVSASAHIPGPVTSTATPITGQGVVYGPSTAIEVNATGDITQMAPIVVTPGGSSSIVVGNTKDVQRALNTLGYTPKLTEDGQLGAKTTANIKAFQSKNHLAVDGVAGPATKTALSAALMGTAGGGSIAGAIAQNSQPATGTATTPTGQTVSTTPALVWTGKDVQRALNQLGASPRIDEDGVIGPITVAAIKSFQTAHGIEPDGIAGPVTKTALYLATATAMLAGPEQTLTY